MKKYLLSALALPLLFACSSEDYLDQKATDNDQFAGIEKVDATFSMADSPSMRMATKWDNEVGDQWGFAWLTDGKTPTPVLTLNGKAYQNHPLNQVQENGVNFFKPETSIYVGKYYLYRPYDKTVVDIEEIHFNSLEEQTISDATTVQGSEAWNKAWNALANTAINIGDKFTNVTKTGTTVSGKTWDKPGIGESYQLYGATFSNQTALDLTYQNNNPKFGAATAISGATDINYTIAKDEEVGAADIYGGTVNLTGAAMSFTYAPKQEPNASTHSPKFWADQKDLNGTKIASSAGDAFTWNAGAITLKAADAEKGISTKTTDNKGFFWFNSLPVTAGNATNATNVVTTLETSYGVVTLNKAIKDCAYAHEQYTAGTGSPEWIKLSTAASTTAPKAWNFDGTQKTFINHYGNHKGKYALTVDFKEGKMKDMHIKSDEHLQKLLKYYIASGKTESSVNLYLDKDADGVFKLSKISIALLQTINKTTTLVTVRACSDAAHKPSKIIITQDGQTADNGLAGKTEVPALTRVFTVNTAVYLSKDCDWTWGGGSDGTKALNTGSNVSKIINEGKLTVTATNIEMGGTTTLENAKGATMDITKVTTVKDALTNLGIINVKEDAELRAYDVEIKNDATGLKEGEYGVINNYGVVGVSETGGSTGKFNNYGLIDMKDDDAITLLTTNELVSNFDDAFDKSTNKMGTVKLPDNNPTALVSVNNAAENGFIKYNWDGKTYATPTGIVKYNTIVVDDDITFTAAAPEVQYIEFNGTKTQVVNPTPVSPATDFLSNLKGIMVNAGKSIIIEKTNQIVCANGAFLGEGATVYKGGIFTHNANVSGKTAKNYFGTWSTDQIVKY